MMGKVVWSMCTLALLASAGHATPATEITGLLEELPTRATDTGPRFAFTDDDVHPIPASATHGGQPRFGAGVVAVKQQVTALSSDGKAAWVAADVKGVPQPDECAPEPCRPNTDAPHHATGLLEKGAKGWTWVAWHIARPVEAKEEAALRDKVKVEKLDKTIAGAEDAVAVFEASLADPKAFAASVSDRKDVVLYGSSSAERTVGGAKVRTKLASWNLKFTVIDGIQAGVTANKTVAFVAANVDAMSLRAPSRPASPYRVLAIYEKTGPTWKLVQANFSVDRSTD